MREVLIRDRCLKLIREQRNTETLITFLARIADDLPWSIGAPAEEISILFGNNYLDCRQVTYSILIAFEGLASANINQSKQWWPRYHRSTAQFRIRIELLPVHTETGVALSFTFLGRLDPITIITIWLGFMLAHTLLLKVRISTLLSFFLHVYFGVLLDKTT